MNHVPNEEDQCPDAAHHTMMEAAVQLLKLKADTQDTTIFFVLQRLGTWLGVDRGYMYRFSDDLAWMSNTHEWCAEGIEPQIERIQSIPTDAMPWWKKRLLQTRPVLIPAVSDLPPEAHAERDEFTAQGIQSLICLPLIDLRERLIGFIGFDAVRKPRAWSKQEMAMLSLTAHLLATALGRSRAEEMLRASKQRLRLFLAHFDGIIYQARHLSFRPMPFIGKVKAITGYAAEDFVSGRLAWSDLIHAEDLERVYKQGERLKDFAGYVADSEYRIRSRDGDIHWVRDVAHALRNDEGQTRYIQGLIYDITERKRTEEALREAADLLARSQQIAHLGSWKLDVTTKRLQWSDETYRIFGCAPQKFEVTYEAFLSCVHPDDRATVDEAYTRSVREEHTGYEFEHRIIKKNTGEERFVRMQGIHEFDDAGEVIQSIGMVHDITARKRTERYHALSAEILKQLNQPVTLKDSLRAVLAAIRTSTGCDAVGIRLSRGEDFPYFVRNGFSNDFLLTEDTLIARDPQGGICRGPDGKVRLECTCGLVIAGKTDPSNALFSPGGSAWTNDSRPLLDISTEVDPRLHPRNRCIHEGYASIALIPIRTRQQIVGLLHINHRKKNQFTDAVVQLLEGVAAHIGDALMRVQMEEERGKLEAQIAQAQKMEAVRQLAAGVAHDFSNMLTVISGQAEMAMNEVGDNDRLRNRLHETQQAAMRSADLIRQLLAFARRDKAAPKVLDLNETLEGMLTMLRRLIGEDIDLVWRPGSDLNSVCMDPAQLDQILVNLCVNARDAITEAGKIIVETGHVALDEAYCAKHAEAMPGEFVKLAVSDNGCGMDTENLVRVFEPYFTTKVAGKGSGLGLAAVYGMVKQSNGFISVYSEPGHGTTFTIYLPQHAARTAPKTELIQVATPMETCEAILLVEDESILLKMTTQMLEETGYTVIPANTPEEAIRLAREFEGNIDLLITDVIMPEMNGRDLARNLVSISPGIKRLFMSGYPADVIAPHGVLDAGIHFLQKPFTSTDMAAKIREALDSPPVHTAH